MSDSPAMMTAEEFQAFNAQLIAEFRANDGKVGGKFAGGMFDGAPLLLLTTTGAKSGQLRIAPLVYTKEGDRYVIIASKGGAPTHPDWYHNILANPNVTVEIGAESFPARAKVADAERNRLFDQMASQMPNFAEYQRNTARQIPVVTLERVAE